MRVKFRQNKYVEGSEQDLRVKFKQKNNVAEETTLNTGAHTVNIRQESERNFCYEEQARKDRILFVFSINNTRRYQGADYKAFVLRGNEEAVGYLNYR